MVALRFPAKQRINEQRVSPRADTQADEGRPMKTLLRLLRSAAVLCSIALLLNAPAHAFVGGLAVAMGRASEAGEVRVAFSADARVETEQNTFTTHVYYKPGMVRDDMNMGGQKVTTIQRYDQNKVWLLMSQGMYMEFGIGESKQAPEYELIERTVEGTETVNGMETTKYKTVYEGPDGRFGGFTWVTDDNIAVKGTMTSESRGEKQRITFTLTNVERESQPDSLFELPANARRVDVPSLGGLAGFAGAAAGQGPAGEATSADASVAAEAQEEAADFGKELAGTAAETAKETAEQETKNTVRDKVRKGLRGLLKR
jgi:hypothetical protein